MKTMNKIIKWLGIIASILVLMYLILGIIPKLMDNGIKEFDNIWKPRCEKLGGLYLESGMSHTNSCYLNNSGILYKTLITEFNGEWYLQGDFFIITEKKQ